MGKKLKVNISRVIKEVEKGLTSRAKNIQHFYTVISALLYVWTNICQDFPGSQFVKTPCFHCRGQGFDLWLVNGDPTCHRAQPKNRKHKNKKQWPTVVAMIFNYLKTFQNILLSREVIWGVFFKKTQKLSAFYFSWNLPGTYYMQPLFTFMISSDSHNNFIDQETNKQKKSE